MLDTPTPQLELALKGLVEFEAWRAGVPPDDDQPATGKVPPAKAEPAKAAKSLFGALREKAKKG